MSPYENRLHQENFRRIALIAEIAETQLEATRKQLAKRPPDLEPQVAATGIHHLHIYEQRFDDRNLLFIYFESDQLDQEQAAQQLKQSSPWWAELEATLSPHPRAQANDAPWQRAEFINVVGDNTARDRPTGNAMGLAAGLHPDKELWYRTLHQTNWPGVIDQMHRSHYQNWTTFMLEFGHTLRLFTHVEYLGQDLKADGTAMAQDPVTQRWWTHTEPCLYPLIQDGSNWTEMNSH